MNQMRQITAGLLAVAGLLAAAASVPAQVFDPSKVVKPAEDPGADAPDVEHRAWKWEFGDELLTGMKYTTKLTIENACESDQTVSVFTIGLKELTFPELAGCALPMPDKSCAVTVPPGTKEVAGLIESDPKFYYVDPMARFIAPRPFTRVNGTVVVFHAATQDCLPRRDEYQTQLELHHLRGAIPPPPAGPEKIVGAGPCQVWWNTEEKPDMLEDHQKCEPEIRPLAIGYRERILAPHIQKAPADWVWLPTSQQMLAMSSEELVAVKVRAEALVSR